MTWKKDHCQFPLRDCMYRTKIHYKHVCKDCRHSNLIENDDRDDFYSQDEDYPYSRKRKRG
ncbi:hypothetical protein HOD96_00100 [Candidatus Falkowbacteria bacterium]|nr:hypothetical protein [Candidatus Falkowbacteria bacterium]MBT4432811.1 hypothetical protein [Candidatus Falkowbacteria bacterium]